MFKIRTYKSRKYFQRILLSILLLMVLTMMFFAATIFYYSENRMLDMQSEANQRVLAQVEYNISYMNEMVRNMAITLNSDSELSTLLYDGDHATEDLFMRIQKLQMAAVSVSFMDSIMIYNGYKDTFFSSVSYLRDSRVEMLRHPMYNRISEYMNTHEIGFTREWIPFSKDSLDRIDIFSFILYDTAGRNAGVPSAFILNVKSNWLFENIKKINDLAGHGSSIIVMDKEGKVMNPDAEGDMNKDHIKASLDTQIAQSDKLTGYYIDDSGPVKNMISYVTLENGWHILSIQDYDIAIGNILKSRTTSLIIAITFIILSIFVSIWVSNKLYQPIEKLVSEINGKEKGRVRGKDEIGYILDVYNHVSEEMNLMKKEYGANQDLARNYYLRTIVTNSSSYTIEEFAECIAKNQLNITLDSSYIICKISIDDSIQFLKNSVSQRRLLYFAIGNIAGDIITNQFSCETINMGNGELLILISTQQSSNELYSDTKQLIKQVQHTIDKFYKLSLTFSISPIFTDHQEISNYYNLLQQYALYRLVYGKMSMITPDMYEQHTKEVETPIPPELEKKLIESVNTNNQDQFGLILERIFEHVQSYHYDFIIHSTLQVLFVLKRSFKERYNGKLNLKYGDLSHIHQKVIEQETITDIVNVLNHTYAELAEQSNLNKESGEEEKNDLLVETIKEMIETNYMDMNMSLQTIVVHLGMSDQYVGRLFKNKEGVSVAEYINEIRINQALPLLENGNYTVKEVMERVGIGNESHFFRVFKKKFGKTPREYRLNNRVNN